MLKYCCCLPLRIGTLTIVLVETIVLIGLSLALTTSNVLPQFSLSVGATVTTPNGTSDYTLIGHVVPVTDQLVSNFIVIICCIQIIINIVAIYAAYKRNAKYTFPWLVLHSIYIALALKVYIGMVIFLYLNQSLSSALSSLLIGLFVMIAYAYFIMVVKEYHKEIKSVS